MQKATGAVPNNRNLSQFLTTFGLDLLSRPPQGGFFSTVAQAAQQPTQTLFDNLNRERDFQRQQIKEQRELINNMIGKEE